ncbi:MAG: hypothetical protein HYW47_00615 [Deltaproteobacteria bacterium]|nr:hypothetical protein [Deltaproteobacteria bacterium]
MTHLDFKGVRSFTQSFVSGLLIELYHTGIDLNQVTFEGITENDLIDRFNREKNRLIALYNSDAQKSQTSGRTR